MDNFSEFEKALDILSQEERASYVLRRYGRFSYKQIAKLLNKRTGTISSSISQAREKLHHYLKDNIDLNAEIYRY